jgi:hypothetical protein
MGYRTLPKSNEKRENIKIKRESKAKIYDKEVRSPPTRNEARSPIKRNLKYPDLDSLTCPNNHWFDNA